MATEKNVKDNPWLVEAEKYDEKKPREDIHDMKFHDNKEHLVRLLPSPDPKKFPYYGYIQHWIPQTNSKKNRPITHPIDQTCIVCEWISDQWKEINRLKEEEDMTDKSPEVQVVYKRMDPVKGKKRYDFNIIDRNESHIEKEGVREVLVKRMASPFGVYEDIFRSAKKNGSPSDEEEGYDFSIVTSGEQDRRQYSCQPERDDSPLSDEEKAAIKKCYDLAKLRKTSTSEEIITILQNAKAPYNEISEFANSSENTRSVSKTAEKHEEKKTEKLEEKVEEKKAEPQTPIEPVKSTFAQEEQKPQPPVENVVATLNFDQDTTVLDDFSCKGTCDLSDVGCNDPKDPCPAKDACLTFKPIFDTAKNLGLDISEERKAKDILTEVKEKMQPQPPLKETEPQQTTRRRRRSSEDETVTTAAAEPAATNGRQKKPLPF